MSGGEGSELVHLMLDIPTNTIGRTLTMVFFCEDPSDCYIILGSKLPNKESILAVSVLSPSAVTTNVEFINTLFNFYG